MPRVNISIRPAVAPRTMTTAALWSALLLWICAAGTTVLVPLFVRPERYLRAAIPSFELLASLRYLWRASGSVAGPTVMLLRELSTLLPVDQERQHRTAQTPAGCTRSGWCVHRSVNPGDA